MPFVLIPHKWLNLAAKPGSVQIRATVCSRGLYKKSEWMVVMPRLQENSRSGPLSIQRDFSKTLRGTTQGLTT